jgi:hypothetical protein
MFGGSRGDMRPKQTLKVRVPPVSTDSDPELGALCAEIRDDFAGLRADLRAMERRMTLRLGGLYVAGVVLLAVLKLIDRMG